MLSDAVFFKNFFYKTIKGTESKGLNTIWTTKSRCMVKEKRNFTFLQNENILTLAFLSKAGKTKECEFHERPAYMTHPISKQSTHWKWGHCFRTKFRNPSSSDRMTVRDKPFKIDIITSSLSRKKIQKHPKSANHEFFVRRLVIVFHARLIEMTDEATADRVRWRTSVMVNARAVRSSKVWDEMMSNAQRPTPNVQRRYLKRSGLRPQRESPDDDPVFSVELHISMIGELNIGDTE